MGHFLSFLLALSLTLPLAFHILSGCEKLGVNYGQRLQIAVDIQNRLLCGLIYLCSINPYQEYLPTFKSRTSQVGQRARPLSTRMCVLRRRKVKPKPYVECVAQESELNKRVLFDRVVIISLIYLCFLRVISEQLKSHFIQFLSIFHR